MYLNELHNEIQCSNVVCLPSVNLARPPVGWHKIVEQPAQTTTP